MTAERPAVILVRTQEEGNLGAAARAMANMGLERLILVAPQVPIGDVAIARAVGARHILERAAVAEDLPQAIAGFSRVVGTTSTRGRQVDQPPIGPRELPAVLAADPPATATALVFGPEASGLTVDELSLCAPCVRIPCSPVQPTLNLAQAVLIVAWELAAADGTTPAASDAPERADQEAVEGLFARLRPLLADVGFDRDSTFDSVVRDLRRLAARAALTEREVRILHGIRRRVQRTLDHRRAAAVSGDRAASDRELS